MKEKNIPRRFDFDPLILPPSQSAIDASSFLLIADPMEKPFANRVSRALRGDQQPLAFLGRMSELWTRARQESSAETTWAQAIALADKKLNAVGFEPAGRHERIPLELGSVGPLAPARAAIGISSFLFGRQKTETPSLEQASKLVRGLGDFVGATSGLAYTPPFFDLGSDRVFLHVNGRDVLRKAMLEAGRLISESGAEISADADQPKGDAFALLHESFHMVQERDAWRQGALALMPEAASFQSPQTQALAESLAQALSRNINASQNALARGREASKAHKEEREALLAQAKEEKWSPEKKKTKLAEQGFPKEEEILAMRDLRMSSVLKECFADQMAVVAMAEGNPTKVAILAEAVAQWRDLSHSEEFLTRMATHKKSGFVAKFLSLGKPAAGDCHQTQDALRLLAKTAAAHEREASIGLDQWAQAARACALSGALRWMHAASQRPRASEQTLLIRGRSPNHKERAALDGELARDALLSMASAAAAVGHGESAVRSQRSAENDLVKKLRAAGLKLSQEAASLAELALSAQPALAPSLAGFVNRRESQKAHWGHAGEPIKKPGAAPTLS